MLCAVCHKETPVAHGAGRPRKYCSTACRQRAYRQRREHGGTPRRPAPARLGCGEAGQVVAVVFVPAAMAGYLDQKMEIGRFLEWGIMNAPHAPSDPVLNPPTLPAREDLGTPARAPEVSDPAF